MESHGINNWGCHVRDLQMINSVPQKCWGGKLRQLWQASYEHDPFRLGKF